MRVLSVDTTTAWASVAILRDGDVAGEIRLHEDTHSRSLFLAVEAVLKAAGWTPFDVDGYVVAVGPGSFTGVRVGISAVQGLALASGRPCLPLTSLLGLAAKVRGSADMLVPMIDAYREQVYAAIYGPELELVAEAAARSPEALLEGRSGVVAVFGDGALRYRDRIRAVRPDVVWPERSFFVAAALGRIATERFAAGERVAPEALRPVYLRPPTISGVTAPSPVP